MIGVTRARGMIFAGAAFFAAFSGAQAIAAEKLDFVLNWKPGGDHAPVYWAKKQGWYADAGIDLNIIEGSGSGASVKKVGVGQVHMGIADLPTALQGRGKGADVVAVMNIYANSPYGLYWKKSSGIKSVADLKGKKIGNPPFDAARQMWPAIAKVLDIPVDGVNFVNVKPNAKVSALKSGSIDVTTHFYNVHYIYERIFGDDMGFVALRDVGFNPYGNSIVVNGKFLEGNKDTVAKFVKVTQKAYAACVVKPEPCIQELASAGSQKVEDVTANWNLVTVLMDADSSRNNALGYFDPARMASDYEAVAASFKIEAYEITDAYTNDMLDMSIKMTGK